MSAARKLEPLNDNVALLEGVFSGQTQRCTPVNPFYNIDLSVLVAWDQASRYSESDPSFLIGPRESVIRFEVWGINQKQTILDEISAHLTGHGLNATLITDCCACADELMTNAIFNAPFKHKMDRKMTDLKIPGSLPVIFDVSVSDVDVAIMCADPFGSLDVQGFFKKILDCYHKGVDQAINYGEGGAGIGSFMIFEQSLSMIVALVPGKRTTFFCRFPKKMSSRKRQTSPKNLIILQREET